jgi:hypothetical protein
VLDWLRARWQQGIRTSGFPRDGVDFPERFRGRRCAIRPVRRWMPACGGRAPSAFLTARADGPVAVDVGACLFSPDEAAACPEGAITYSRDHRLAARTREGLVSPTGGWSGAGARERTAGCSGVPPAAIGRGRARMRRSTPPSARGGPRPVRFSLARRATPMASRIGAVSRNEGAGADAGGAAGSSRSVRASTVRSPEVRSPTPSAPSCRWTCGSLGARPIP